MENMEVGFKPYRIPRWVLIAVHGDVRHAQRLGVSLFADGGFSEPNELLDSSHRVIWLYPASDDSGNNGEGYNGWV